MNGRIKSFTILILILLLNNQGLLDNPSDGWSTEFPAGDGQRVGATAVGTVKNGAIILFMSATTAGRAPILGNEECTESAGTPTACQLDIPKTTLP